MKCDVASLRVTIAVNRIPVRYYRNAAATIAPIFLPDQAEVIYVVAVEAKEYLSKSIVTK